MLSENTPRSTMIRHKPTRSAANEGPHGGVVFGGGTVATISTLHHEQNGSPGYPVVTTTLPSTRRLQGVAMTESISLADTPLGYQRSDELHEEFLAAADKLR